ncbi:acyl-CoA synthetase [Pseudonocardia eucalypti]|uniref:Acyl-CoA synthetase n=1 Tax=Pseudonocardia eucalypti TaxID=648755 RepID=A0ABP9PHJ1_9PSEU|nr:fatty-acyl-CoA synthase [Pseudonocardia eucalypti]
MSELNFATTIEAVATAVPDRPAVVHGARRTDYRALLDRSRRLARYLHDHGLGCFAPRASLAGHQSGQHFLAQYLYNSPEYLEGMLGGYLARVAPFNVNYRYVPEELRYLLADARPRAIQYHARFAPVLAAALAGLSAERPVLLQVADDSGEPLLPGAVDYESALASVPPSVPAEPSPDDVYALYTGGTTGMPKCVLWRQADVAVTGVGLVNRRAGREWDSVAEVVGAIGPRAGRMLPCAPLMHGAAQWGALLALCTGNTVVFPDQVHRFDPAGVWDAVARERVTQMSIVGDAFGRALVDELARHPRDVSSLKFLVSGGAALQPSVKEGLASLIGGLRLMETIGSSETGVQGAAEGVDKSFHADSRTVLLTEDRSGFLAPGHPGTGWLASRGRVPLGYLGDEAKTSATFPVVNGERLSVPGDRARLLADGRVELLGRDSVTINSGGEKVFAEEVEAAVKRHPDVADAVVCGRPSARWGAEVVAIVAPRSGATLSADALLANCATTLARYKLPKEIIFVDRVQRSPSGKADYRWAAARALLRG